MSRCKDFCDKLFQGPFDRMIEITEESQFIDESMNMLVQLSPHKQPTYFDRLGFGYLTVRN